MDSAKWQKIKDVLSTLLDLPENEHSDFLAKVDDEIRFEAEKLLSVQVKVVDFIDKPILLEQGLGKIELMDNLIGQRVENYLIIERIGTGGMGAVYLATRLNSDFKQKVALKIIKRGMDSEAIQTRFAIERRILSTLKHRNIAQLLDGGISAEGLSFFVMEYVDGKPLNQYCNDNKLSLFERLEVFRQICSAVDHAHKNLIIHRDLKPSNILVTNDGIPKLLDFGIAKLLSNDSDEATLTATHGRVFTPEYASPEQVLGKPVTTATDVYSLGVILYELLSGYRPFETKGKSFEEIVKSVCETEPTKPSEAVTKYKKIETKNEEPNPKSKTQNLKSLRGDLDNIILKSLRKEPAERYGSVQQFSEDIRRFLQGLPILARPQTLKYRFEKYVKRNKAGVLATALVLLSLIGGISVATWQAIEARRERVKAEQRFNDVRQLANNMIIEVHDSIKDLPGSTPARATLVKRALDYLDKLANESRDDLALQRELAIGYEKIGDVQGGSMSSNLGDTVGAIQSYQKSLEIRESLASLIQNHEDEYQLAMLHSKVFQVMMLRGDISAAEFHCRQAIKVLEKLTVSEPENLLNRITQARFHLQLGELIGSKPGGTAQEADENYRRSVEICELIPQSKELNIKALDGLSLNEKIYSVTQLAYRRMGYNQESLGKNTEALEIYRKALADSQKLLDANNPQSPKSQIVYAISLGNVGRVQANLNKFDEALSNTKNMQSICEKIVKEDPQNYLAVGELASAFENTGFVYLKKDDSENSIEYFQKARDLREKIREKSPDDVYNIGNLGETLAYIGDNYEKIALKNPQSANQIREARKWHQRSLEVWLDLEKNNKLPAYYSGKIQQQKEALTRCQPAN